MEWSALMLLLLAVVRETAALQWSVACGGAVGLRVTAAPEVPARYTVHSCSEDAARQRVLRWKLVVFVETGDNGEALDAPRCHGDPARRQLHSSLTENINQQLDCEVGQPVCFSADLDLLYSGCYVLQSRSWLSGSEEAAGSEVATKMVEQEIFLNNSVPNIDLYIQSQPLIDYLYGDPTMVHWSFGHIPVTDFTISLEKVVDGSAEGLNEVPEANCSVPLARRTELLCSLSLAAGRYELTFEHRAPWVNGTLMPSRLKLLTNVLELSPAAAARSARAEYGTALGWAAGGLAALLLLGLLVLRRGWALHHLRDHVKHAWFEAAPVPEPAPRAVPRHVLLLYARDCEPLMCAARALRDLLHTHTQVLDLHCARSLPAQAPAPAEWLRRAVCDPHTAVVLLETPAARMLYTPAVDAHGQVSAPLLGSRVLYRAPTHADSLLLLALQLVQQAATQPDTYHRLYIATTDASAPVLEGAQQFRRYPLPGGAARLLADVCGRGAGEAPPALLGALRASLDLLHQHVRDKPDYLRDELMFL